MFETINILLKQNIRNIKTKIKESPVLYLVFLIMMIFSILVFSFTTYFLQIIETKIDVSLNDLYFIIFFIFFVKSAVDFYNSFIKSDNVLYPLSTEVSHKRTISEIFLSILIINLIIWFSFSGLYLFFLSFFRIEIFYPFEYLNFFIGVLSGVFLGITISINFFSPKRYRLIPTVILLAFFYYVNEPLFITLTCPLSFLHLLWSIRNAMESHKYIRRKERLKEKSEIKIRSVIKSLFYRETTIIWRDKLFYSFVSISSFVGLSTGYLYVYGDELFIPERLLELYSGFLPSVFVFIGVFVVVIYTAVFPSLNLFLNEEKTMWIIRHLPLSDDSLVFGKTSTLILCFVAAIPFIPYTTVFLGIEKIIFLSWFLAYSFIAGVIVSVPLGVKYVGKKSDIMLLYSVSMILFGILGFGAIFGSYIESRIDYYLWVYLLILIIEAFVLFLSLKISTRILRVKYS